MAGPAGYGSWAAHAATYASITKDSTRSVSGFGGSGEESSKALSHTRRTRLLENVGARAAVNLDPERLATALGT